MSERPSTSRERIIPILIEGEEKSKKEQVTPNYTSETLIDDNDKCSFQNDNDASVDDLMNKRVLPMINVKEKIILVVDSAEDENFTPFKLTGVQHIKPLDMLKRAVELFLNSKHNINKNHEYALAVLNENNIVWLVDFTSNINDIVNALRNVSGCETEDIFQMNSLFDTILQKCDIPEICEMDDTILPPPFVLRTILLYGRSYTMPELFETDEIRKLLNLPYFTLDVLMTHEPVDDNNNCNKIFNVLQNFDKKGFAYFFPVARDMKTLFHSVGKLLGHPLQRPTQECANYSIKIT